MYGNTQRALLEFAPLSKWRILPRKGLFSDDLNMVSCYKELFQTPGDGYSSSLVYTTCYYDSEQPIWR